MLLGPQLTSLPAPPDPASAPGCGGAIFQKFKFFSTEVFQHLIFCPVTEGQMCCSIARAEEWGSKLPSADPPAPHLPSYHSVSLPRRAVVRTTPLSSSQKKPCANTGDLAQLRATPDPKPTLTFSSIQTLDSCSIFYDSDFAAGSKLGGRRHFEQAQLLGEGRKQQKMLGHLYIWRETSSRGL